MYITVSVQQLISSLFLSISRNKKETEATGAPNKLLVREKKWERFAYVEKMDRSKYMEKMKPYLIENDSLLGQKGHGFTGNNRN